MSRSKKLCLLAGILLVVCLSTIGVSQYEVHKEKIKNSDQVILTLNSEDVKALSWEYESETLSFHRDEKWAYDEDENFPVSEKKINEMLEQFQEFGAAFVIEEVEDYGQYGLENPLCRIRIETDEDTYEILLGDYSTMDSQRYVAIREESSEDGSAAGGDTGAENAEAFNFGGNVYLVKKDPLDEFDAKLSDMILHDEIPDFTDASELTLAGAENYTIVFDEERDEAYCAGDVYFTEKEGGKPALDTERVRSYLQTLRDLNLTDYVSYDAGDKELSQYGLDQPELTLTAEYSSREEGEEEKKDAFVLSVARDPEERKSEDQKQDSAASEDAEAQEDASAEEKGAKETAAYARVGESQIIYRITEAEYEALMKYTYNDLRHQEVFYADAEDIYQADITLEGNSYTLTREEEEEEKVWYYGGENLESENFQSALTALRAESFTSEQPSQKEEISLKIYLHNEKHPEVSLVLYRYDGDRCLAVVDGVPTALVKRSDVVDLIEAVNGIVLKAE